SASILKIANSAMYARRSKIKDLDTAVNMIGFKKIKTMVLLLAGANLFKKNSNSYFYQLFWQQSIISAFIAKEITTILDKKNNTDEYFTAALIHRIGEVPLYLSDKEKYLELLKKNKKGDYKFSNMQLEAFSVNSNQIGGELLEFWEFPKSLVNSARYACCKKEDESELIVDVVTLSDYITTQIGFGIPEHIEMGNITELIQNSGLGEDNYQYLISELFLQKIKKSVFFKECQNTLGITLLPGN
ncbi:MAG: HDOD domain-containing protein, partial [Deltaproteobacteria bacterium]|nr:HDOD domain-containing protein [Deltaproteobacteria bacterium]